MWLRSKVGFVGQKETLFVKWPPPFSQLNDTHTNQGVCNISSVLTLTAHFKQNFTKYIVLYIPAQILGENLIAESH